MLSGISEASVYFTETGVGIAVPVPHAVGDVVRIVIPYSQTEGFRTDDPAWNSFQSPLIFSGAAGAVSAALNGCLRRRAEAGPRSEAEK